MISLSKIYSGGRGANENRLRFGAGMVVRHGRRPADYPQNAAKRFVAGRMSQKMCTWKFWQGTPKNTPWFEICAFGSSPTSSHGLWERESGKRVVHVSPYQTTPPRLSHSLSTDSRLFHGADIPFRQRHPYRTTKQVLDW